MPKSVRSNRLAAGPARVVHHIQQLIDRKQLGPGDRLPSERELAERFNMGHMTVRRGLSALVADGVVERRVGLGTFVAGRGSARPKRQTSLRTIAMALQKSLADTVQAGFYLRGLRRVFPQEAYSLDLLAIPGTVYGRDFFEMIKERNIDGLVFKGYLGPDEAATLRELEIPVVSAGAQVGDPTVPHVSTDYEYQLDRMVREAHRFGHRELVSVGWDQSSGPHIPLSKSVRFEIIEGYQLACRRFNLVSSASRIIYFDRIQEYDPAAVDTSPLMELDPLPTCIIVHDEIMAAAVYRDLEARGLSVPDDVSLMANIDSMPHAHRVPLSATDGQVVLADRTERAAFMLKSIIEDTPLDELQVRMRPAFQFKASLGPAPGWRPERNHAGN